MKISSKGNLYNFNTKTSINFDLTVNDIKEKDELKSLKIKNLNLINMFVEQLKTGKMYGFNIPLEFKTKMTEFTKENGEKVRFNNLQIKGNLNIEKNHQDDIYFYKISEYNTETKEENILFLKPTNYDIKIENGNFVKYKYNPETKKEEKIDTIPYKVKEGENLTLKTQNNWKIFFNKIIIDDIVYEFKHEKGYIKQVIKTNYTTNETEYLTSNKEIREEMFELSKKISNNISVLFGNNIEEKQTNKKSNISEKKPKKKNKVSEKELAKRIKEINSLLEENKDIIKANKEKFDIQNILNSLNDAQNVLQNGSEKEILSNFIKNMKKIYKTMNKTIKQIKQDLEKIQEQEQEQHETNKQEIEFDDNKIPF